MSDAPLEPTSARAVMARAATENFPVASRVLPRRSRAHLLAIYGFARLLDEVGDSGVGAHGPAGHGPEARGPAGHGLEVHGSRAYDPAGHGPEGGASKGRADERLASLDLLERELDAAWEGRAEHPLLIRLEATLRECALPREPFARLIEANRVDQRVHRYETWDQLRGYCGLSANPVGELVLGVFGLSTPPRIALSDSICTALQLAEHCQDVAEDRAAGRVYLPAEDLERFGCSASDLLVEPGEQAPRAGEPLRRLLAFEVSRARMLLVEGEPLIDELRGRERLAVAAFAAGGRAALDAIERARYDVLAGPPRAGGARRLLALLATLLDRSRARL